MTRDVLLTVTPRQQSLHRMPSIATRAYGAENPVILEAFEWNLPADHQHWRRLRAALPALKAVGIDSLWLPPGSKGADAKSNGYDIYDAYDLGEFDQKNTVPTKWGTKQDLTDLAAASRALGMGLLWDAILNHRAFADSTETVRVVEVDPRGEWQRSDSSLRPATPSALLLSTPTVLPFPPLTVNSKDRRIDTTEPFEIEAWTKFDYAARGGKYSTFRYNKRHFNGTDWDQKTEERKIYRFVEDGKNWAQDVGTLQGNADYLMLENIDYKNPEVVHETNEWGKWIVKELGLQGFRLDAVQHYSREFVNKWARLLRETYGKRLFFVGEFWHGDVRMLTQWLDHMSPHFCLYDVPLMYNIARLSTREASDLREVFKNTLVATRPDNAVTFIRIHDTQRGQAMDTPIGRAFTPHAYSLLLLRKDGIPCVFFGDLYGICDPYPEPPTCWGKLPGICLARKLYAHGPQIDYFERAECVGWVRQGTRERPHGMAVVMSWTTKTDYENLAPRLSMCVGRDHAHEVWTDLLGFEWASVVIDENGYGTFPCQRNSMACFVNEDASERERFPVRFDADFSKLSTAATAPARMVQNGDRMPHL